MQIRVRLASISLLASLGLAAGCGDDLPREGTGGKGGGVAGAGGGDAGGVDGGPGGSTGGSAGRGGTGGGGTGGGGTGGAAGRGGTGGTGGTGGAAGRGGTGGTQACYPVTFVAPTNGATLTVADDTSMSCADGFQFNVRITTSAPAGTTVQLFVGGTTLLGATTVANGAANFPVQLISSGESALSVQLPSTAACTDPSIRATVTVNWPNPPPTVQIVAPQTDAPPFADQSKHLLAANAPVGLRDKDGATPGAQTDVVACTNRNGSATLLVGQRGGNLSPLGTAVQTVAATAADNCPAGLGLVARFTSVTLPDSVEDASGGLVTATEIAVRVAEAVNPASVGTSTPVDLWVDPVAPLLTLRTPANLCGSFQQSSTTVTQDVTFNAENASVVLRVTNNGVILTRMNPTFAGGVATFTAVEFDPGRNDVTASESDLAGNVTTLTPVPCSVTIGSAPVVTFTAPTAGQLLCPSGSTVPGCVQDSDAATAGWQGTVTVHVTAAGQAVTSGNVTFTIGTTTLGMATIDASGNATLTGVTLPEGSVTIVATTNNIPDHGVGSGSVTVTVDLGTPTPPSVLTVTELDRRQTSFQLSWIAPNDNGSSVTGY